MIETGKLQFPGLHYGLNEITNYFILNKKCRPVLNKY